MKGFRINREKKKLEVAHNFLSLKGVLPVDDFPELMTGSVSC